MTKTTFDVKRNRWLFDITQGRLFKSAPIAFKRRDGGPIVPDNIQAACWLRPSYGATPVAKMASSGTADGTITVSAVGLYIVTLTLRLPATFTKNMEPSLNSVGAMQLAGVGDIKIWSSDYESGQAMDGGKVVFRVYPEGTV